MHLLATEDVGWLLPLFERQIAANSQRRLGQLGLDANAQERALRAIRAALESEGYVGRSELVRRMARLGIEVDADRRVHLFRIAVAKGVAIQGPDSGSETLLALALEWMGERPKHDRDAALAELARRYLRAFGPATEVDFAGWSGLGLGDVRAALRAIGDEIEEVRVGEAVAFVLREAARPARGRIVRLLPGWDNYLMGHRDRDFLAPAGRWRRIMPGGGIIRPTITVGGVAMGTWSIRRKGRSLRVELNPFADLDAEVTAALDAEIADIERFEGR
jgi:hypothetical protein